MHVDNRKCTSLMDKTSLLTLLYMHACWREQTDINISLQRQSLVHRSFLRTDDLCLTCSLLAKMFRSLNLPLKASLIPCSNAKRSGTNWCPDLAALSNFEHWTKGRIRVTIGKHTYDGHLSRTIHLGIRRPRAKWADGAHIDPVRMSSMFWHNSPPF